MRKLAGIVLVALAGCATTQPELDQQADACTSIESQRAPITNALVAEIDEHRYDDCGPGTECLASVSELAAEMNAVVDAASSCAGFERWRAGMPSQVDPREVQDGTLAHYESDAAREALYVRLVDAALAKAGRIESASVIMTMGAPGSGKSYVLNHLGLCQSDVVLIDPDEFKRHLVEYQAAIAADDKLAADRVHRESSMLSKRARDKAMSLGLPLCIDGVMSKKQSAIDLITRLKDNGYHVTIVAVSVPFDVAYERVIRRGEETGRFVPFEFAKTAHANIEAHREELLKLADVGYLFDTNQPYGEPPLLIRRFESGVSTQSPSERQR